MRLKFDSQHNPIPLTLVLAKKDGTKLGVLPVSHLKFHTEFNSITTLDFCIYKSNINGNIQWSDIVDFKLLWLKEFDLWFEIHTKLSDGNVVAKQVTATTLAEKELSQTNLYGVQINTEEDILRDDYKPTIFYDDIDSNCSLLHRLLSKTPHYAIKDVPLRLRNVQRTFSFDGKTVYESLMDISEEIGCYFDFAVHSDENGKPDRRISVYDLQSYCLECHSRGDFKNVCTKCGSDNIQLGYGVDSGIYVSTTNLTDEITFETNEDSVKNCFKMESGDDLMNATIANCNPNGSLYLWHIPNYMKKDMPEELQEKLNDYDDVYEYYQNENSVSLTQTLILRYNELVEKYQVYNSSLTNIPENIIGFPALMKEYYNIIDFESLLRHSLMPESEESNTTAIEQLTKLTTERMPSVAVPSITSASSAMVDNTVLLLAKAQVDRRYQVKIISSSYSNNVWVGNFSVTNYYNDEDTAISPVIQINVVDTYGNYVEQMLEKSLAETANSTTDIVQLFKVSDEQFAIELKKYALNRLDAFKSSCSACLDIMAQQCVGNNTTWSNTQNDLYVQLYTPYLNKLLLIESEIQTRQYELGVIVGIREEMDLQKNLIQTELNFENYLGSDLWKKFIAYRREDVYSNPNYISDGLEKDNAELINQALQFIEVAKKDLYNSANLQHSLSATLKNLLAMQEFQGLIDNFEIGNYIHIKCDDEIYNVRLISCEIDFDNLTDVPVTFSDITEVSNVISDIQDILNNSKTMATSYGNIKNQAEKGNSGKKQLDEWTENGLSLTNLKIVNNIDNQDYVFDEHGMLFREYSPIIGTYHDEQLKIIHSTIAITDNNWKTVKTAIGKHYYINPITNEIAHGYGINGEVIIGKMILGENLGIYNHGATLQFNQNGLTITNNDYTFMVSPNDESSLVKISSTTEDLLKFTSSGKLYIKGEIEATAGHIGGSEGWTIESTYIYNGKPSYTSEDHGIYIGTNGIALGDSISYVKADKNGQLTANNILATGGTIGGCEIIDGKLQVKSANIESLAVSKISAGTNSKKITFTGTFKATNAIIEGDITAISGYIGGCEIIDGKLQVKSANIESLDASKITTGTIDASKVSVTNLNASNIKSGTLSGCSININSGTFVVDSNGVLKVKAGSIMVYSSRNVGTIGVGYHYGQTFDMYCVCNTFLGIATSGVNLVFVSGICCGYYT